MNGQIGYRLVPVVDIHKYLSQNRRQFVQELKSLVRFASVSTQPERRRDVLACADWLARHFRSLGLDVKLYPTKGNPILVARTRRTPNASAPRVLVYGHYDVQPPDPLELWKTPPFEPVERGGKLFGRGASDNKGQFFAHVKAVEAYLKTRTPLPVDVMFLIEGEEEVGSENLVAFVRQRAKRLRAEYVVVSDTGMFSRDYPTLTYATRGTVGLEVRVEGPSRDLHSGVFGGSVANPAMVLSQLLAGCVDTNGHITIPGFYAGVKPLAAWERRMWQRLPFDARAYRDFLGVPRLAGEKGFTPLEQRWARPTFEINGLTSGYQGPGGKTIVPAWASAKIACRIVPGQNPAGVLRAVERHLRWQCPKSVRLTITGGHTPPFFTATDGPGARAALAALEAAFGRKPVLCREGGSLPILDVFRRQLYGEILLVGLGLPDDNWHSPNEKMDLGNFQRGIAMSAELLRRLGLANRE
ncbi:MAG TPA: dipeptidase [Verrucomicrobiae bacterium]|nr:dipeptidase [Verrucomicrobiae bacterium]